MNKNLNGFFQFRTIIPMLAIIGAVIFFYAKLNTKVEVLQKEQDGLRTKQESYLKKGDAPSQSDVEVLKKQTCSMEDNIKEIKGDLKDVQRDIKTLLQRNPGRESNRTSNPGTGG